MINQQTNGEETLSVRPCNVFDKSFSKSWHLTTHRCTYTGQKPYASDVCGTLFLQSSNLTKHRRTHTGEKP